MSSSLRRGALAASVTALSIASLAACGSGNNAQTLQVKPDNAATSVGDIKVQNALVITQPDRESTGPAAISATLFNTGGTAQTLDAVKVEGGGKTAEIKPANGKGKLTIPAHSSVVLGGKGNATAMLTSGREAVQDGNAQKVVFTFSKTGDVTLTAFVVPATSYFSNWGPAGIPSAPAQSPSQKPSGSPSGSTSPSPSQSPSGTPTDQASASTSPSAGH
ncbi:copper chaperone PCu(A)C [Streptomyces sp. NPDC014006]|uniref:copper chaperone PCu(A)C n=1 Tax=Streptomyces sp. NPDC014006 TaxID=3364870 RepID=UPI0037011428